MRLPERAYVHPVAAPIMEANRPMNLTIIVPTYNRSLLLNHCLTYLRKQNSTVGIIVADSSKQSEREINKATIARLDSGIKYFEFDGDISPVDKVVLAIDRVSTKFACLCADDDLLVVSSAMRCAEFLEENPEYSACHGCYLRFKVEGPNTIVLEDWEYQGPSVAADSQAERVINLLSNYEALFYSVQTTSTLRASIEVMGSSPFPMQQELANGLWLALAGKVKRLDDLYYFRQAEDPRKRLYGEPSDYLAARFPTIFSEFDDMATRVIEKFHASHGGNTEDNLLGVLRFGFFLYLYRSISLIQLAKIMIPRYPHSEFRKLGQIVPPTVFPSFRMLAMAFLERGVRYIRRKTPFPNRGFVREAVLVDRLRTYSASTGTSIVISRKLSGSLPRSVRDRIREISTCESNPGKETQ